MTPSERARLAREIRRANGGQLVEAGEQLLHAFVADDKATEAELRGRLSGIHRGANEQRGSGSGQATQLAGVQGAPATGGSKVSGADG